MKIQSDKLRHFPEAPELLCREKDKQRAEISRDVERYLAAGGVISSVRSNENREARLTFRDGPSGLKRYSNDEDRQRRNNRGRDITVRPIR